MPLVANKSSAIMTTWLEYQNINMIQRLNWQSKTWQSFALRAKEKKTVIWCFDQFWTSLQNKQNRLHIKLSTNLDGELLNYMLHVTYFYSFSES